MRFMAIGSQLVPNTSKDTVGSSLCVTHQSAHQQDLDMHVLLLASRSMVQLLVEMKT